MNPLSNPSDDFSALRALIASTRQELPQDTQVDQFLIEFHRRQRAQLLVPQPVWARATAWVKERLAGIELLPSLSYGSAFAAIALTVAFSITQDVQVTQVDGQSRLSFHMPNREVSFAMVPVSMGITSPLSPKVGELPNFTPAHNDSSATRYVLATNSHGANDAPVAF